MQSSVNFEVCNDTELYQLCRKAHIPVVPGTPKEVMIALLLGEKEPDPITEGTHPIDSWRHGLAGFVLDHWSVLEPQITCPIKSKDPRACFGCLDTQVVTCVVQNPNNEQLIELHRRKE
jgi:hypothetical protein